MVKKFEVYDVECLKNLFTYTGYDYKNNVWYKFVICQWRNDTVSLLHHLEELLLGIGYNNEKYDYPLLHHLINHADEYAELPGDVVAQRLYVKSQEIIDMQFSAIADRNKFIKQIDLFAIMGYDNVAMRTSLKDLEIALRLENVEEMPFHHTHWCKPGDEEQILEYNENDVYSTYMFLLIVLGKTDHVCYKGDNRIELRSKLSSKFGVNVLNVSDIRMGERLLLKMYCNRTGDNEYKLKKCGGSPRPVIHLKDCLPPWTHFDTPEFKRVQEFFETHYIYNGVLKGALAFSNIAHGCKMDYGAGGVHSCIKPGVYIADDDHLIVDEDIGLGKSGPSKTA